MNDKLDEILHRTAERTFEMLAFMLPAEAAGQAGGQPTASASVSFSGPINGKLVVSVEGRILPELAANMLGLEDHHAGASTEQQADAVKELANVTCGNLLPEIAGSEAEFAVCAPEFSAKDAADLDDEHRRPVARASLRLDSGRAELALFMDEPCPVQVHERPPAARRT